MEIRPRARSGPRRGRKAERGTRSREGVGQAASHDSVDPLPPSSRTVSFQRSRRGSIDRKLSSRCPKTAPPPTGLAIGSVSTGTRDRHPTARRDPSRAARHGGARASSPISNAPGPAAGDGPSGSRRSRGPGDPTDARDGVGTFGRRKERSGSPRRPVIRSAQSTPAHARPSGGPSRRYRRCRAGRPSEGPVRRRAEGGPFFPSKFGWIARPERRPSWRRTVLRYRHPHRVFGATYRFRARRARRERSPRSRGTRDRSFGRRAR